MQTIQCNNGIETSKTICVDKQRDVIETQNSPIRDNNETVLSDLDCNESDKVFNIDLPNLEISKLTRSENKSHSLRKNNSRKSLSLQSLNKKVEPISPKCIQENRNHRNKSKNGLESGKHISLDIVSLEDKISEGNFKSDCEAVTDLDNHQSYEENSNKESLKWLILNISNLDYNGFELNDPTASMPFHFDANNPTESGRNSR